jgi:hypothetical protein
LKEFGVSVYNTYFDNRKERIHAVGKYMGQFQLFLTYFPYFEKIKVGL